MTTTAIRLSLIGAGEHLAACRLLGTDEYSDAAYVEAVSAVRESGAGEAYADRVLGVDVDALIGAVEADDGELICQAAERNLRRRGLDPRSATYGQYADALVEAAA
jgi:hypothetical protein